MRQRHPRCHNKNQKAYNEIKLLKLKKNTRSRLVKKYHAALDVANQHAWHLWHRTGAGRHVSPARLPPSMLHILQLPDTTPQLLPPVIRLSRCVSLHACQSIRRHSTPPVLCSLFYWKRRRGEVVKGDSTLKRGQTDGLCMGYLQPGGDWGNLAVGAEIHSQGSQAKAPQNVIKSNISSVLGKAFVLMHTGKLSSLRCDACFSFTLSIHHEKMSGLWA